MAVDLCNASPRISFSHDLCVSDTSATELPRADSLLMESNDFDFCVGDSFEQDSFASCADELFSDGKILPQGIKKQQVLPPKPPAHKKDNLRADEKLDRLEKLEKLAPSASTSSSSSASSVSSKSLFWRLTRSSSCGNGYTRSLICNLPLLSRSNSTGSAPKTNSKNLNSNSTKGAGGAGNTKPSPSPSSSSGSSSFYPYSTSSKRNYGSKNSSNGIRVNPILNVPPPYISRGTVNLFGFGSLFCHGKDKEKNKKKRSAMVN